MVKAMLNPHIKAGKNESIETPVAACIGLGLCPKQKLQRFVQEIAHESIQIHGRVHTRVIVLPTQTRQY